MKSTTNDFSQGHFLVISLSLALCVKIYNSTLKYISVSDNNPHHNTLFFHNDSYFVDISLYS